ncbi:hypothetical protein MMPV_009057 [Pyropia vietnamensis]
MAAFLPFPPSPARPTGLSPRRRAPPRWPVTSAALVIRGRSWSSSHPRLFAGAAHMAMAPPEESSPSPPSLPSPAGSANTSANVAPDSPPISAAEAEAAVRALWAAFDSGAFSAAAPLFTPDASYVDTLYRKPFAGRDAITGHLRDMESAFPSGFRFVLDDIAPGGSSVGARWHVETPSGRSLPAGRGASMYTLVREGDAGHVRFAEAWDFPEPSIKAAGATLLLLRGVSALLKLFPWLLK